MNNEKFLTGPAPRSGYQAYEYLNTVITGHISIAGQSIPFHLLGLNPARAKLVLDGTVPLSAHGQIAHLTLQWPMETRCSELILDVYITNINQNVIDICFPHALPSAVH
ncbi:MAG: hypothetical protein IME93_06435 [Proteobacteria bacterium]|nr:hypothetical protein [Pseudomonadota bacterium]